MVTSVASWELDMAIALHLLRCAGLASRLMDNSDETYKMAPALALEGIKDRYQGLIWTDLDLKSKDAFEREEWQVFHINIRV